MNSVNLSEQISILIVEDDAVAAQVLQNILKSFGWNCLGICRDAISAFTYADSFHPDIVFMDIGISGQIDGVDTAEILKSRYGIHVIFVTASSSTETLSRITHSEPFGYILKPFSKESIFISVRLALVIKDMTRRMKEKDDRLNAALSAAKIGTWRYDLAKETNVLDAWMSGIMGFPSVERLMSWEDIAEYVHPDDREAVLSESRRAFQEGSSFELDIRFLQPDGSIRWVKDRGICCKDEHSGSSYMTGAVVDITEQKMLEDKLLGIYESQRQDIGQILHDEIGQQLTGISLMAESISAGLESKGISDEYAKARHLADRTYRALDDLRNVSRSLYPVQISPDGLSDALETLAHDAQSMSGITVLFENRAGSISLDNNRTTQLFYSAREAVNNAIRHSGSPVLYITIKKEQRYIYIEICDHGCGFDPSAAHSGIGLHIMKFRAKTIGGKLDVVRNEKGGATVSLIIPEKENIHDLKA